MSKYSFYLNAAQKVIHKRTEHPLNKDLIKKNIYYGVKLVGTMPKSETYEEVLINFQFVSALEQTMSLLSPYEFMNLFPIKKDFVGHKYGAKDYFSTKLYISSLDLDKPIGNEINHFLWNYTNDDIEKFVVESLCIMSKLRRFEGKPSIAEEWADINEIATYTQHTDYQGKQYILDSQGRTHKVNKPRPKHLKLVQ